MVTIRQDRFQVFDDSICVEINGNPYSLNDYSNTGFSILSNQHEDPLFEQDINYPTIVKFRDMEIGRLKSEYVRDDESGNSSLFAFMCSDKEFPTKAIKECVQLFSIFDDVNSKFDGFKDIPASFKTSVLEFKSKLVEVQSQISTAFTDDYSSDDVAKYGSTLIKPMLEDLIKNIIDISKKDDALLSQCYEYFRSRVSILYEAPVADRCYSKPLNYAGDYEMMNIIYRNRPEGNTLLSKMIHYYCVNEKNAKAVRNRVQYLGKKIAETLERKNGKCNILSVASGPAEEVKIFINNNKDYDLTEIKISLLDQDIESLKYAQMNIKNSLFGREQKPDISYINRSIKSVILEGLDDQYDLIYSAGLFDYFNNKVARKAASTLFDSLNNGGKLIIGNFDFDLESKLWMDFLFDWELIYRSESELKDLYGPISQHILVEKEPESVNLFALMEKV